MVALGDATWGKYSFPTWEDRKFSALCWRNTRAGSCPHQLRSSQRAWDYARKNVLSFLSLSGYDSVLIGQRRGSEKNIISDTISEAKVGCSALRKVVASGKSTYEVHLLRVGLFRHTRTWLANLFLHVFLKRGSHIGSERIVFSGLLENTFLYIDIIANALLLK